MNEVNTNDETQLEGVIYYVIGASEGLVTPTDLTVVRRGKWGDATKVISSSGYSLGALQSDLGTKGQQGVGRRGTWTTGSIDGFISAQVTTYTHDMIKQAQIYAKTQQPPLSITDNTDKLKAKLESHAHAIIFTDRDLLTPEQQVKNPLIIDPKDPSQETMNQWAASVEGQAWFKNNPNPSYRRTIVEQSTAYAKANHIPLPKDWDSVPAALLTHGQQIQFISTESRDLISAWGASLEGAQLINQQLDAPQVTYLAQRSQYDLSHLEQAQSKTGHPLSTDLTQTHRLEVLMVLAKAENQSPGLVHTLKGYLSEKNADFASFSKQVRDLKLNPHTANFAGTEVLDYAQKYQSAVHQSEQMAKILQEANIRVADQNFNPNDPVVQTAINVVRPFSIEKKMERFSQGQYIPNDHLDPASTHAIADSHRLFVASPDFEKGVLSPSFAVFHEHAVAQSKETQNNVDWLRPITILGKEAHEQHLTGKPKEVVTNLQHICYASYVHQQLDAPLAKPNEMNAEERQMKQQQLAHADKEATKALSALHQLAVVQLRDKKEWNSTPSIAETVHKILPLTPLKDTQSQTIVNNLVASVDVADNTLKHQQKASMDCLKVKQSQAVIDATTYLLDGHLKLSDTTKVVLHNFSVIGNAGVTSQTKENKNLDHALQSLDIIGNRTVNAIITHHPIKHVGNATDIFKHTMDTIDQSKTNAVQNHPMDWSAFQKEALPILTLPVDVTSLSPQSIEKTREEPNKTDLENKTTIENKLTPKDLMVKMKYHYDQIRNTDNEKQQDHHMDCMKVIHTQVAELTGHTPMIGPEPIIPVAQVERSQNQNQVRCR